MSGGGITPPQRGRIMAQLKALGITERDDRMSAIAAVIYRRVDSTNALTFDEAHTVIDTLDAIARRDDPAVYLATLAAVADRYFAGAAT